jgi:UDP-glucuronate decarboxylase
MSSADGRVVTNFVSQALQGKPLTIYGSGDQTRSFCYCSDLVHGLQVLMNSGVCVPLNFGNPHAITIKDLAHIVSDLVNPGLPVLHESLPIDDPQQRQPSIERAELLLGRRPVVELSQGLRATIQDLSTEVSQSVLQLT